MKKLFVFAVAFTVTMGWMHTNAQTPTGTITGTVRDETGAVIPGATVTVMNVRTSSTRTASTDAAGSYQIPLLPPGEYQVSVEMMGFKKEVRTGIVLQVQQIAVVDFTLRVGQITEEILVTGEVSLVESKSSSVGSVIDEKRILELPLNGREVLQLNLLVPGVVPAIRGSQLGTQGGAIYAHGMREHSNSFYLDGIDQTDRAIGQFSVSPIIDTVREFRLQSARYSAEFGRAAGAQMNVVSKSGTNEFHGSLFWFLRHNAMAARNFFDPVKPPYKRNQFGFTLGGPIVKNRDFFFVGFEGTRLRDVTTRVGRVPTPAMVRGDFSALLPGTVIKDPLTGQPFPGNIIPSERMSRIGRRVVEVYPAPNQVDPVRNYVSALPNTNDVNRLFVRVDHEFSTNDKLFVRYAIDDFNKLFGINLFGGPSILPGFGRRDESRFQTLGGGYTHVFSANVINELRVGYTRWTLNYKTEEQRNMVRELGIPGLTNLPRNTGWPLFTVSGFINIGDATNLPQGGPGVTYQISESLHVLKGRHSLKFGADLWFYRFGNFFLDASARGSFTFTGQFSGHPIADLLLGYPVSSFRGVGASDFTNYQQSYDFYIQDDWKVTPRLTLNLGLRYEYNTPYVEKKDRFTNFYANPPRLVLAGRDGISRSTYDNDPNNFGPRFGFAYDVFGDGKMAIRGGYGIYYDRTILNTILGLRLNPPHYEFNLFLSDPAVPRLTLENPFPAEAGVPLLPSPNFFAKNFRDGYVQQWSLNLQRQVLGDMLVEIGYLGSKGTHLYRQRQINQPRPAPGPVQPRRPYPMFGSINGIESSAYSSYHSLQVRTDKRFAKNFSFLLAYTFSKSIDSSSAYAGNANTTNNAQDGNNLRAEKGLSSFDMRHRFSLSYIIQLPFGRGQAYLGDLKGLAGHLVSGWEITGITTVQSGTPSDIQLTIDRSNTGVFRDRPDRGGKEVKLKDAKPEQFWDPKAFVLQPPFHFGNAGRNILPGPGWVNFDLSVIKNTHVTESLNLQFRAEIFNLFNHPNFFNPERFFDTPLFGKVTAAADPRLLQIALKLIF